MSHVCQPKPITSMTLLWAAAAVVAAYCLFARDLDSEPFFADESADIAQSFYYRLAATGQWNHVDWLHPAAYDHTPVFKYLIGFSLHRAGYQTPRSVRPWERWMSGDFAAPKDPGILRAARIPMMIGAVFGCLMMFWLAWQLVGTTAGLLAAFLLAASPLYFTHARRAMADDLTQALVLAGLVAFVALARGVEQTPRRWLRLGAIVLAGGLACGLAAATKLNGATAGLAIGLSTVAAVTALLVSAERTRESVHRALYLLLGSLLMGLVAVAVFIGINPYFYARPQLPAATPVVGAPLVVEGQPRTSQWLQGIRSLADQGVLGRLQYLLHHRTGGLQEARQRFPTTTCRCPGTDSGPSSKRAWGAGQRRDTCLFRQRSSGWFPSCWLFRWLCAMRGWTVAPSFVMA